MGAGCMPGCMPGCMSGRVPGLVSGCMRGCMSGRIPGRVLSFAPDFERGVSLPLAKGVNMSSLLYIFSTLQLQAKVYHFRGYPIPSLKFCGGDGRLLSIGQLPDAANAIAAAANARTLVRRCSAAVPQLAASSRWCSAAAALPLCGGAICIFATAPRQFCRSASASNKPHSARPASLFATAPWLVSPPRRPGQQHFPDGALPRRPGQQQTSFGGEKYSGLASSLAHLGRIC